MRPPRLPRADATVPSASQTRYLKMEIRTRDWGVKTIIDRNVGAPSDQPWCVHFGQIKGKRGRPSKVAFSSQSLRKSRMMPAPRSRLTLPIGRSLTAACSTFIGNLAFGYYRTPHDLTPFGDLVVYLATNLNQPTDQRGNHHTTVTLTPGFRTHLGGNWYLLRGVEVPVTSSTRAGLWRPHEGISSGVGPRPEPPARGCS